MKALRDLVDQVKLFCGIQVAVADLLEDHGSRLAQAEAQNTQRKAENDALKTRIIQLEMVVGKLRRMEE